MDKRRADAHYPSNIELVAMMHRLGSMRAVAETCGVKRESLRDYLRIRPELKTQIAEAMVAAAEGQFWARTDRTTGCWLWTGPLGPKGYGAGGMNHLAHRSAWELFHRQPIPAGMEIDHLCRVILCIRPDHLEPVPSLINNRRKPVQGGGRPAGTKQVGMYWRDDKRCRHGHEYTPDNIYFAPNGQRQCRQCRRDAYNRMTRRRRLVS